MKKILTLILALTMAVGLCACGGTTEPAPEDEGTEPAETVTLKVAATATPHAEILAQVVDVLAEQGITLEIDEYSDYVTPNTAVEEGDEDVNYFQHQPYLDQFNEENGTHLVSVAAIHYEPFGIYAGKTASLDALPDGAQIAVPNDGTNEARALLLLEQEGLITLKQGVGLSATKSDIDSNPHNYEIVELEAQLLTTTLQDVDVAVINGNYAIDAGLKVSEALAVEAADGAAAEAYANVITVKAGNENNDAVKALVEVLKSDKIKTYIEETYDGAVVPLF